MCAKAKLFGDLESVKVIMDEKTQNSRKNWGKR